jgi:hypothetical protein
VAAPTCASQPGPDASKLTEPAAPRELAPPNDPRIARLARVARVWGEVRYRHPYLFYRDDIDWDGALVAAIPRIDAAQTDEEEATAVQAMLDALHDPATRVEVEPAVDTPGSTLHTSMTWSRTDVLVVKLALPDRAAASGSLDRRS